MSLDFHLADIADYETLCWLDDGRGGRAIHPVTEALIFHSLSVGIAQIRLATIAEFTRRVTETEAVLGATVTTLTDGPDGAIFEPRPITEDDVRAHVGLRTNVSSKTRTAWRRSLDDAAAQQARLTAGRAA